MVCAPGFSCPCMVEGWETPSHLPRHTSQQSLEALASWSQILQGDLRVQLSLSHGHGGHIGGTAESETAVGLALRGGCTDTSKAEPRPRHRLWVGGICRDSDHLLGGRGAQVGGHSEKEVSRCWQGRQGPLPGLTASSGQQAQGRRRVGTGQAQGRC